MKILGSLATISSIASGLGIVLLGTTSKSAQLNERPVIHEIHEKNRHLPHYSLKHESLRDKLTASGATGIVISSFSDAAELVDQSQNKLTAEESVASYVCQAEAIIIGRPISFTSLLSANESQVFTDYEVQPLEILKNDAVTPLSSDKPFVLTRPGGKVRLDIGTIRQDDNDYPPLSRVGRYLLFLAAIRQSQSYKSIDPFGTYSIHNGGLEIVGSGDWQQEQSARVISSRSLEALRADIQSAVAMCSVVR
jgi:hypothetical protein